jgi:hypothetical protein
VIPKKILRGLVYALPLLIVSLAVLSGGALLTRAMQDLAASQVFAWIAAAVAMLVVVDLILLVGVLGLRALGPDDRPPHDTEG